MVRSLYISWFWVASCLTAWGGAAEPKGEIVKSLRNKGLFYLSNRDYNNAARCYAAVLQVTEGQAGLETGQLRRRCSLTLAECEIKLGNLDSAIALCSQVLEEMPPLSSGQHVLTSGVEDLEEMRRAYGKAHYRRGVALDRRNLPHLALYELRAAHTNIPNDENVMNRIVEIESSLSDLRDNEIVVLGNGVSVATDDKVLEEQLHNVLEEAQASSPLPRFTEDQLRAILQSTLERRDSASPLPAFNPMAAAGVGVGALGQLLGTGIEKGTGSPINALLKLAASGKLPGMVSSMGALLGLDSGTVTLTSEVLQAFTDVALMVKRLYDLVMEHKVIIVRLLLAVALGNYYYYCQSIAI